MKKRQCRTSPSKPPRRNMARWRGLSTPDSSSCGGRSRASCAEPHRKADNQAAVAILMSERPPGDANVISLDVCSPGGPKERVMITYDHCVCLLDRTKISRSLMRDFKPRCGAWSFAVQTVEASIDFLTLRIRQREVIRAEALPKLVDQIELLDAVRAARSIAGFALIEAWIGFAQDRWGDQGEKQSLLPRLHATGSQASRSSSYRPR